MKMFRYNDWTENKFEKNMSNKKLKSLHKAWRNVPEDHFKAQNIAT